jgi:hypothetical protein
MTTTQISTKRDIKKAKVIELWKKTMGHVSQSCLGAGITRHTFYDWMKKDKEFATALIDAEGELNDEIRDVLINKASEGDMTAVIFYLKNRHPDFKPQAKMVGVQSGDMKMVFIDYEGNNEN